MNGNKILNPNSAHKTWTIIATVCAGLISQPALAHETWVESEHTHGGEILQAAIGYGHFPLKEPIAADRLAIFKPLELVGKAGKQDLVQRGKQNYDYVSKKPVADGSYLVLATYKPTFWSENASGWKQQTLQQMPDAKFCEQSSMFGKNVVNVGHGVTDNEVITKPVGQLLEMVPLKNPASVQVGDSLPVKVLYKGEPLSGVTVVATFKGFTERDPQDKSHAQEPQAFSHQTNAQGIVNIVPLREGFWKAKVAHKTNFPDPKICQELHTYSTLSFNIGSDH